MGAQLSESTPPNNLTDQVGPTSIVVTQAIYRGPLPPPAVLEHFERILPGAASRILTATEEQLRHQRSIDSAIVATNTQALGRGQWFGLIVILSGMATGG